MLKPLQRMLKEKPLGSVFVLLMMLVLLFIGNPIDESYRVYQAIWNTGHLFLFALLTWMLLSKTRLRRQSWKVQLLTAAVLSLFVGADIELAQYFVGRNMEVQDLLVDFAGGLIGYLLVCLKSEGVDQPPLLRRYPSITVTLILSLALAVFYPVFWLIYEERKMHQQFPVLADFESASELSRWENRYVKHFELDNSIKLTGEYSLYVEYGLGDYPAVMLENFPPDWSAYTTLNLGLHNDQNDDLLIELKIFDRAHEVRGYNFNDRFNRLLTLKPGWNQLQISLQEVYQAPADRVMEPIHMSSISLFIHDPSEPKSIHLDNFYLSSPPAKTDTVD